MEACSSAHHWARRLCELGQTVRLIPPQYVKPYVKRNKTDAADAEAICEAVGTPEHALRPDQDARAAGGPGTASDRALLVRQRTATANAVRGLRASSVSSRQRASADLSELRAAMGKPPSEALPDEAREAIELSVQQLDVVSERIESRGEADQRLAWRQRSSASGWPPRRDRPYDGNGACRAVGDGTQFKSARHFAAWLGLTPRVRASGDKERIGRISQGRRSLPADVADPRRESGGRDNVPAKG